LKEWLEKKKFNKTEKVKAVTAIYDRLDIQSLTNKKISKYFNSGFASIETLGAHVDVGQIKNYALVLMDRQH